MFGHGYFGEAYFGPGYFGPGVDEGPPGATAPDAPGIGTATTGPGSASVSFTPPLDDGGAPITSYTATSTPGGITASGAASPIIVTGLPAPEDYTFTVYATNSVGDSPESAASNEVLISSAFSISPSSVDTLGEQDFDMVGVGTNWGASNPFSILNGPGAEVSYTEIDPTHATYRINVTGLTGSIVVADSDSGTSHSISTGSGSSMIIVYRRRRGR